MKEREKPSKAAKNLKAKDSPASRWISYRPEIKVLDCTIRDGGLMNAHQFELAVVKSVYDSCVRAGIDYVEVGYKCSRKDIVAGEYGAWSASKNRQQRFP